MKRYWEMKNGEQIEISKMTDTHLINTIKMIERNAKNGIEIGGGNDPDDFWYDVLYGKEALDYIVEYKYLKKELKKRNLKI